MDVEQALWISDHLSPNQAAEALAAEVRRLRAAIERVRATCADDAVEVTRGTWWVRRIDVVDALDGDV